jgi:antitoxin component YwqK of YwqJK toxin-antitoxin module
MGTKLLTLLMALALIPMTGFAQKDYEEEVNQHNEAGQKNGYWIEEKGNQRFELYYSNGVKSGIYKAFWLDRLQAITFYENDKEVGPLYFFGDKGHLINYITNFKDNSHTSNRVATSPPFKCHVVGYHSNGRIESEGELLYYDDPMSDMSIEYGEWKYYDETGKLIETKVFE